MPDTDVFSIDGQVLAECSDVAGRAVGTSQTGPDELRRVLLVGRANQTSVRMYATDMFSFAKVEVPAEILEDFNWLLPYPELSKFSAFSADSLVEVSLEGKGIRFRADDRSVMLPKYQGEREFFTRFSAYKGGVVPVEGFPKMMDSVASSHAVGGNHPVLCGVHVSYSRDSGVVLVEASDGSRYARCMEDTGKAGAAVFMDHVVYSGAAKMFSKLPSPGVLGADDQSVTYRCRLGDFSARTLAASKYFDLSAIRRPTDVSVSVGKTDFSRAVAGADIVAANRADVSCVGNSRLMMVFKSGYSDDIRESEVMLPAAIVGSLPKISLNVKHLRDMLRLVDKDVLLHFGGQTDPMWTEFDGGVYLTMPFAIDNTR